MSSGLNGTAPVAVVGSSGFIGARLVGALREFGVPTAAFDRAHPFLDESGPHPAFLHAGTVFVVAGNTTPALAELQPWSCAPDLNLLRTLVTSLAGFRHGAPLLVLASSGGTVYDPACAPPYREGDPINPPTNYGRLKAAQESILDGFPQVPSLVLRLANVYGPGQIAGNGQGVIAHWLAAAEQQQPLRMFGSPDVARDYLYVDDLVELLIAVHRAPRAGLPRVLNVGSGTATTLAEVADLVLAATGAPGSAIEHLPARDCDRKAVWLDTRLAGSALGWRARTPLREGISAALAALRAGRDQHVGTGPHH